MLGPAPEFGKGFGPKSSSAMPPPMPPPMPPAAPSDAPGALTHPVLGRPKRLTKSPARR